MRPERSQVFLAQMSPSPPTIKLGVNIYTLDNTMRTAASKPAQQAQVKKARTKAGKLSFLKLTGKRAAVVVDPGYRVKARAFEAQLCKGATTACIVAYRVDLIQAI